MKFSEIKNLLEQIKQIVPTITIPNINGLNEQEQMNKLGAYIVAFGDLPYENTLRALKNVLKDDKLFKQFVQMPIPTLARETTRMTQFDAEEKQKYFESLEIEYCVNPDKCRMEAWYKRGGRCKEKDRPFTELEKSFYVDRKMTYDEYFERKSKGEK